MIIPSEESQRTHRQKLPTSYAPDLHLGFEPLGHTSNQDGISANVSHLTGTPSFKRSSGRHYTVPVEITQK